MNNKVIVLGIDGATFDLFYPWIEQGKLPNLSRVLQEGTHGAMRSTIPPYSAQAWVSMMTGKDPAKHGVVDFFQQDSAGLYRTFISSTTIHGEALWDILSKHGKQVGTVNVPLTYPPVPVNGYMVSGFMTPKGREDYTYPAELRQEILSVTAEYNPDPWDLLSEAKHLEQGLAQFIHWMDIAERVARHLRQRYNADALINVIQALDQLQHSFWDLLMNEIVSPKPEGSGIWPVIERCYQMMDEAIGQRMAWLDNNTTLFLVSDHGFQKVSNRFNVNCWLAECGWLRFATGQTSRSKAALSDLGLTRDSIKSWVRRLDAFGLRRHVGRFTRAAIANKLDAKLSQPIDWAHTLAYSGSRTSEGIYINLKGRQPQGVVEPGAPYEELRERIMAALAALIDPDTGQPVVSAVYRREDIHSGPFLHLMPDIIFSLDDKPYLTSDSTTARRVFEPLSPDDVRGRHHSRGIFAAIGPHIVPGLKLKQANITDVAPTILYAMELPIPTDMDGRVLEEAFTVEYRQAHPIRYEEPRTGGRKVEHETPVYTEEEDTEMQRRLHDLGYIS